VSRHRHPPARIPMSSGGWRRSLATRLTVVATGASAIALMLLLAGLYVIVIHQLDATVVAGLRARAADLQTTVGIDGPVAVDAEQFAQLYNRANGAVVRTSPALTGAAPRTMVCCASGPEILSLMRMSPSSLVMQSSATGFGPNCGRGGGSSTIGRLIEARLQLI